MQPPQMTTRPTRSVEIGARPLSSLQGGSARGSEPQRSPPSSTGGPFQQLCCARGLWRRATGRTKAGKAKAEQTRKQASKQTNKLANQLASERKNKQAKKQRHKHHRLNAIITAVQGLRFKCYTGLGVYHSWTREPRHPVHAIDVYATESRTPLVREARIAFQSAAL